jgi:hypothetical protein
MKILGFHCCATKETGGFIVANNATDMDGPISCSLVTPEHEKHIIIKELSKEWLPRLKTVPETRNLEFIINQRTEKDGPLPVPKPGTDQNINCCGMVQIIFFQVF